MHEKSNPFENRIRKILGYCICASLLFSIVLWAMDPKLINDTFITSSWIQIDAKLPDFAKTRPDETEQIVLPVEWVGRYKRNEFLWVILLAAWFFPAKILIQTSSMPRALQVALLGLIFLLATTWILSRLVTWDEWPGVTLKHNTIGTPIKFLFVPLAFVIHDFVSKKRTANELVKRIPIEILLIFPWRFIWAMIQMFVLHWTWL